MAHHRFLRAVLIESNDLRRDAVQRFQGGFIVLPQLGILQTLQDAPFRRFVQRGRERLVLLDVYKRQSQICAEKQRS